MKQWYMVIGYYAEELIDEFTALFKVAGKDHVIFTEMMSENPVFHGCFNLDVEDMNLSSFIDQLYSWGYISDDVPSHFLFIEIGNMNKYVMKLNKIEENNIKESK